MMMIEIHDDDLKFVVISIIASSAELDDSKVQKFTSPLKVKHRVEISPIKWNQSRSPSPCHKGNFNEFLHGLTEFSSLL